MRDPRGSRRFCRGIDVAHHGNGVAGLDVSGLDLLGRIAAAVAASGALPATLALTGARTRSFAGPAHSSGYLLEDARVRGEVDGV